jgi:HEAT repeat protein
MSRDDDRLENARRLAEEGDGRAVAEFCVIATDQWADDDVRLEAARGLAEIDRRAAVSAFRSIALDATSDDDVRLEAAHALTEIDPRAAAEACHSIAVDRDIDDDVRLEAARLAEGDSRWAVAAFRAMPPTKTSLATCAKRRRWRWPGSGKSAHR